MAMVKADAYGHGMVECARVFNECGAAAFGVAEVIEGVRLRQAGLKQPIFILAGILPALIPEIFEYKLTPVLVDDQLIASLAKEAEQRQTRLSVHLKVDAGMGRQGCLGAEVCDVVAKISQAKCLRLAGIMAHYPMADDPVCGNSKQVLAAFRSISAAVMKEYPEITRHIANSGGIFSIDGSSLDMVRPGISLYGYGASPAGSHQVKGLQLQPVMSFVSRVIQVRQLPSGHGLGYGHLFTTTRKTRLAVLPVGYEDGYLRALSNRASVLIHGLRAPVVGRISMNLTLVDISDIENVKSGDEVVLLGRQGSDRITADEIAGWMDTISYEVLCLFGHCNRREYVA